MIFFFASMLSLHAQDVLPSTVMVNTSFHGKEQSAKENAVTIFYNSVSKEIYIVVDFAKFNIVLDSADNWLADLKDTRLVYRGTINSDNLLTLTPNNSKSLVLNGKIKFNQAIANRPIDLVLFEISKDGVLYRNNNNDYYDRIRTTFEFSVSPMDFNINKKPHHLTKPIMIKVENGYINEFKPGMEDWIGNNY